MKNAKKEEIFTGYPGTGRFNLFRYYSVHLFIGPVNWGIRNTPTVFILSIYDLKSRNLRFLKTKV